MALYPAIANSAGTLLRATLTLPATHDAAGFAGLTTGWVEIGYVTDMGGFPRETVAFESISTFNQGRFTYSQTPVMDALNPVVVFQDDDAGQDLIEANANGETKIAFDYVLPTGDHVSVVGYATGYAPQVTTPEEPVSATWTIQPIFDSLGNGVIRWEE